MTDHQLTKQGGLFVFDREFSLYMFQDLAVCQIGFGVPQTICSPKELDVKATPQFKFPFSFSGSASDSNASPHCSTISAGSQDYVWGVPTSLQGQLGPVCVFSEGLQENFITALHAAGNDNVKHHFYFCPPNTTYKLKKRYVRMVLKDHQANATLWFSTQDGDGISVIWIGLDQTRLDWVLGTKS